MASVTVATTNCPVARMFLSVSFSSPVFPARVGQKARYAGLLETTVKKEKGARLGRPSASTVDTRAMGLGTTISTRRL